MGRSQDAQWIFLICLALFGAVRAGGGPYYYTGAQWAVQAQCPASYPLSCNAISQGNYCCPTGHYCTWADARVACCPDNCVCSGWTPEAQSSWRPHSSWHPAQSSWRPHSSYHPPPRSSWHAPPPQPSCHQCGYHQQTTTVVVQPQAQSSAFYGGGYCRTVYATGPGLPTSRQGDCGLVLYESPPPNAAGRTFESESGLWMLCLIITLQAVGGMVLFWR